MADRLEFEQRRDDLTESERVVEHLPDPLGGSVEIELQNDMHMPSVRSVGSIDQTSGMRFWLAVVHRDHVRRGVEQGIAQVNHGSKAGVAKLQPGDGLVFYSPRDVAAPADGRDGTSLQAFTAIGRVADGDPWQAAPMMMGDRGEVSPWRRRVEYLDGVVDAPIAPLLSELELTRATPNWGWIMRRGLLEVTAHDFALISREMGVAHEMGADTLVE